MKRCPYCGEKYPAGATVCATDETPLEDLDAPRPLPASSIPESDSATSGVAPGNEPEVDETPEGFRLLGTFEPMDADKMLEQFVQNNLRFQIDRVERQVPARGGYRMMGYIEIYVHENDFDAASKIMSADWKV